MTATASAQTADNPYSAAKVDLDEKIKKLNLTPEQKKDLVEFLKALDGAPISLAVPTSFPQ